MGTTISGSIESSNSRQGVEINDFEQVYASMLPRLLSNASPAVIIDGRRKTDNRVFDDTIISVLTSGTLRVVPNHEVEQRDLGMPKTHYSDTPYFDIGTVEPVSYIQDTDLHALYPIILDDASPVDPGSLDGVLEPFTIRDTATRRSTEGSYSSRRVRGGISGYGEDPFGYNIPLQQIIYSYGYEGTTRPYQEYGIDSIGRSAHGFSYFAGEPVTPQTYFEDDSREWDASTTVIYNDSEIISALSGTQSRFTPYGVGFRSSATGYTYFDNVNGTDSITFFDRKGY